MPLTLLFLSLSLIIGNMFRLDVFGISLPYIDIALFVCLISCIRRMYQQGVFHLPWFGVLMGALLFSLFSLGLNIWWFQLGLFESIHAFLYWGRFVMIALLPYYFSFYTSEQIRDTLLFSSIVLAVLGYIQYVVFPDFSDTGLAMNQLGWDPHQGRLLSTWFDPNYVGMVFVSALALLFPSMLQKKPSLLQWVLLCSLSLAILATFSRSVLLGCMVFVFFVFWFTQRRYILLALLVFSLALAVSPRLYERVYDGAVSGMSLFGLSEEPLDPTSDLRVRSWKAGRDIGNAFPWFGIGYNTLPYIQGVFWPDITDHAASGIDASILTLYATHGVFGSFLVVLWVLMIVSWFFITPKKSYEAIASISLLFAFCIHSLFVNSFFFTLLVPYIAWALSVFIREKQTHVPLQTRAF